MKFGSIIKSILFLKVLLSLSFTYAQFETDLKSAPRQYYSLDGGKGLVSDTPLIFTRSEYDHIQKDVLLISRAMVGLYNDIIQDSPPPESVIPSNILNSIVLRYLNEIQRLRNGVGDTNFLTGIDIVKSGDEFKIFEFNVAGWMGGLSTVAEIQTVFTEAQPELKGSFESPEEFYSKIAQNHIDSLPEGEIAVLISPHSSNSAFAKVLNSFGIKVLNSDYSLSFQNNGVYLDNQKVGLIHVDMEASYLRPEIWTAFKKGNIKLSTPPAAAMMMDKAFLPFLESIVKFYTNNKIWIKPPPTTLITEENLQTFKDNPQKYVFKPVEGRGGAGIFIKEYPIQGLPTDMTYIAQEFVEINSKDDLVVDFRPHAYVNSENGIVTTAPWSRSGQPEQVSNVTHNAGLSIHNATLIKDNKAMSCKGFL